jgi:uncharacterized ferritin-like protein (DUF455 family)
MSLRPHALALLQIADPFAKAQAVRATDAAKLAIDPLPALNEPAGLPGRPLRPLLVAPQALKPRSVGTPEGHATLIHALTHIEANAINLALDIVWRFAGLPVAFYTDWWQVAVEEALHFDLLSQHLRSLGYGYGDFPAHDGLWDMAQRTRGDVLARLALVPRTLEARGLDATPAIRNKLMSIGDPTGARILDVILRDEITHVAAGNRWFKALCAQQQLDPMCHARDLARAYHAPVLKGPFNLPARRAAGFEPAELDALDP